MQSLSESEDSIDQVKSEKKPQIPTPDGRPGKKFSCKFCGCDHVPESKKCLAWSKVCKRCNERNHFVKGCKDKDATFMLLTATKTWKR